MIFFRLFTLCSARVSALGMVLSDSPCETIGKKGDLSDFERGQIVCARLDGASLTKIATLLGVPKATVSKVMSAYTNHGKTTPAKRNSGRNSALTERDRRTLRRTGSKNHRTTASQVTGQQN
jgi:transposase